MNDKEAISALVDISTILVDAVEKLYQRLGYAKMEGLEACKSEIAAIVRDRNSRQ